MNRRKLSLKERETVYGKMQGHCAYCGCELAFKDMQVDHVIPLKHGGEDTIDNMLPACRGCNHYKRNMELGRWREQIEQIPHVLERGCYTYRRGVSFGVVEPKPHKVVFYFERMNNKEEIKNADYLLQG